MRARRQEHEVYAARVLIVDDHADTADAMQMLLTRAGYDVRVAYSGAEAISVASQFKPDLAILDILLSDMNGYDLAPRLRAITGEHGLRLIALSGCQAPNHALAACFDEVARKPIRGTELQRLLRRFMPQ
jgi:CheY-like chemotaxis protein